MLRLRDHKPKDSRNDEPWLFSRSQLTVKIEYGLDVLICRSRFTTF